MMLETFLLALRSIRRNVLRSSLTMLGIVIGVAAVISMVTVGSGATAKVTADISQLGSNLLQVRPGQGFRGPGGARSESKPFTAADGTAIADSIAGLQAIAPTAQTSRQAIVGSANWSTSVTGTTNAYLTVRNWELEEGRQFSDGEMKAGAGVCIIGQTVQKELFGSQSPLGKTIRLGRISFKVIGTLQKKGQ